MSAPTGNQYAAGCENSGRPRIFKSPEHLEGLFNSYIDYCEFNKRMANIAGFMAFLNKEMGIKVHKDTYYACKTDYEEFSEAIKYIDAALEDATLNNTTQLPLIRLAYLNNRCGYTTKQEIKIEQEEPQTLDSIDVKGIIEEARERKKKQQLLQDS